MIVAITEPTFYEMQGLGNGTVFFSRNSMVHAGLDRFRAFEAKNPGCRGDCDPVAIVLQSQAQYLWGVAYEGSA